MPVPNELSIRAARAEDAERLCAIYNAASAEAGWAGKRSAGDFVKQIAKAHLPLLVADAGEGIVGWAGPAVDSAHSGQVGVYVATEARGRQIGTALTEMLALFAEEAGLDRLTGILHVDNVAGLRLAERCDFHAVAPHDPRAELSGPHESPLFHVERLLSRDKQ